MRVLVIGSGGREHAISWKIAQSPRVKKLYCAPGNGGISKIADLVDIKAGDMGGLLKFAKSAQIDLTVVGPETPLVAGIVDVFQEAGLKIFGPVRRASMIEGSKIFAKEMMKRFGIPTADFLVFDDYKKAKDYISRRELPFVIKADGLAAGKGVAVCRVREEALAALKDMMVNKKFGGAGEKVIIEECLEGEEASIIVISDGENIVPLTASQDHKQALDGDKGLNTGGMGAYSPAPVVTPELERKIMDEIVFPVIRGMAEENMPYKGVLYAGIMITGRGPKVLEFNVRFGDPETQAIFPRLKSDLIDLIERSIDGNLKGAVPVWDKKSCVCVVMASGGYPGEYEKEKEIKGLSEVEEMRDVVVFHAGTKTEHQSTSHQGTSYITDGGRVLGITGLGDNIELAVKKAYEAVSKIKFENVHFRADIGKRAFSKAGWT
ncbi:MAG: phosphoribosylamine--glycine ligase [Candidatus Omnitrophota bacterium]|nr:phosphoribosylamine--glycine ligase [Candidatus Omnitrophota bacterium]